MSDDNGAEEIEEDAGGLPVRHHTFAPRIRAGVISVNELKKLVETAEEEGAKNVKLGGEIVFVWERGTAPEGDLEKITGRKSTDFKFGGVRPVKMCSAETFCRRFRQPVLGLAEKLDELYFNEPLETKLVIGVAGCHRSCSEPATKDVGIIATPAGYDMLVGGSGGLKPRIAKKVYTAKDMDEVIAVTGSIVEYVRKYGRRTLRLGAVIEKRGMDDFITAIFGQEPTSNKSIS